MTLLEPSWCSAPPISRRCPTFDMQEVKRCRLPSQGEGAPCRPHFINLARTSAAELDDPPQSSVLVILLDAEKLRVQLTITMALASLSGKCT